MNVLLSKKWFHLLVIGLATLLVYSNIFANGFAADDKDFVLNWQMNRSWDQISGMLKGATPEGHEGVYRPVRGLVYIAAYQLFGSKVFGYHVFSLVVHLAMTLLVYLLIVELTNKKRVAFVAALIFGVHPIHVEAITNITTAFDEVGIVFMVSSLLLYLKARENAYGFVSDRKNLKLYWLSVGLAGLAFFTYELTLTLPLLFVLVDVVIPPAIPDSIRDLLLTKMSKGKVLNRVQNDMINKYLPYWVVLGLFVYLRTIVIKVEARAPYQGYSFYHTQLANFKAMNRYIAILLNPMDLNINHTLPGRVAAHTLIEINEEAILGQSLTDIPVVWSLTVILGLVIFSWKYRRKWPVLSLGILWFFVAMLPVMNLVPNASLLHEKYAYLASVGYVLVVAWVMVRVFERVSPRGKLEEIFSSGHSRGVVLVMMVLIYVGWLGYLTFERNKDWKNDVVLWEKTVTQSPANAVVHYKLGSAYRDVGDLKKAKSSYLKSLELYPDFVEAMNNLGVIAEKSGEYDEAESYYLKALQLRPSDASLYNNLGVIHSRRGEHEEAISKYKKALSIDPNYEQAAVNLQTTRGTLED